MAHTNSLLQLEMVGQNTGSCTTGTIKVTLILNVFLLLLSVEATILWDEWWAYEGVSGTQTSI